ncbi:hypothetical protein ACHAWU_005121 [Discostella pseudostelligera]|uniref:RanBD1 domain-containing protein n=1 Tax=Discostella pseudostelligera TaxID=259834 RepID=A0ABD3LYN1_9STRA
MSMPPIPPIRLEPPGEREEVDRERAEEFVKLWTEQLREHRAKIQAAAASNSNGNTASSATSHPWILCDRIRLSDKSYTIEAAQVIASFLTEPLFDDYPPLAHGIIEADLSDIIAGRMTEEAILVLKSICDAFANSNLIEVDLSENAIGGQGIGACETVVTLKSLERLSFCNNGLSGETMKTVADWLTRDNDGSGCIAGNLTKLHIYNNMSGEEGCTQFARIFQNCTRMEDLRFSSTRAGEAGSDIIASVLDASLGAGNNPRLRKLDLCDNTFSSTASHVASFRALVSTTCLSHLNLGDCGLGDDGVRQICRALCECDSNLEHLDLSGNNVTRCGDIADYIRDCGGKLKTLRLEENGLTSKGVKLIAAAFRGSEDGHSIEELQLNNCMVGAIGARALIDAFGPNGKDLPKLNNIFLNGNSFAGDVLSELEVAFDFRLGELEDNDSDGDADDDLSDDEEEEDERDGGVRRGLGGLDLNSPSPVVQTTAPAAAPSSTDRPSVPFSFGATTSTTTTSQKIVRFSRGKFGAATGTSNITTPSSQPMTALAKRNKEIRDLNIVLYQTIIDHYEGGQKAADYSGFLKEYLKHAEKIEADFRAAQAEEDEERNATNRRSASNSNQPQPTSSSWLLSGATAPAAAPSSTPTFSFGATTTTTTYSHTVSSVGGGLEQNEEEEDPTANPEDGKVEFVERMENIEEEVLYEVRAIPLKKEVDKWTKREKGALRVYRHKVTRTHRMVVRDECGKVHFNVAVSSGMRFEKVETNGKGGKKVTYVLFGAVEEESKGMEMFMLQVKPESLDELHTLLTSLV